MENIWDDIFLDEKNDADVLKELKEQAKGLSDKTRGMLYADVVEDYEDGCFNLGIVYSFYICAPYLGNKKKLIFIVGEINNQIILVDKIGNKGRIELETIHDLTHEIRAIISSNYVIKSIQDLYRLSISIRLNKNIYS